MEGVDITLKIQINQPILKDKNYIIFFIQFIQLSFFQVSGSHFNPAISIASVLMKRITILRGAAYICAQCGGAIAGAALVYGVYGRSGAKNQFGEVICLLLLATLPSTLKKQDHLYKILSFKSYSFHPPCNFLFFM